MFPKNLRTFIEPEIQASDRFGQGMKNGLSVSQKLFVCKKGQYSDYAGHVENLPQASRINFLLTGEGFEETRLPSPELGCPEPISLLLNHLSGASTV